MSDREVECPFCGYAIEYSRSEIPYANKGCAGCGADLQISRVKGEVTAIRGLPRTETEWNTYSKSGTLDTEDKEEALEILGQKIAENPSAFLNVRTPGVDEETMLEVMQKGLDDADYGVSKIQFSKEELIEMGLEF